MINFKIKENKQKIFFVLLLVLLISSWFYWFQWRPAEIRKDCFKTVAEKAEPEKWSDSQTNNYYRICLVKRGVPAESLLVNID